MLLSSNVALIGGNSTKPGSSYYALTKAVLSLFFLFMWSVGLDHDINNYTSLPWLRLVAIEPEGASHC